MVRAEALRLRRRIADQLAGLGTHSRLRAAHHHAFRLVGQPSTSAACSHRSNCCGLCSHQRTHHSWRLALALGRRRVMLSVMIAAVAAASVPMTVAGPKGDLAGTFVDAGKGAPVVLIIPGSGPTDRDGNNPLGVKAAPYRMLADALVSKGVSTLRADKRGMFGSKAAIPDANSVTIADYATDAHSWADALRKRTGAKCIWLLGHSEGALVALEAGRHPQGICGLILVAGPGR